MCVCADGKGLCLLQFDSEPLMKSFLHFDLKMLVTQHLSAQMFHILAVCLIFCMHYSIILSHFAAYLWFLECEEWESRDAPSTYSPLTVLPVHYMLLLDSLCSHFLFSLNLQPVAASCLILWEFFLLKREVTSCLFIKDHWGARSDILWSLPCKVS